MWEEAVIKRERAAWLSRQSEVDELKRQVEELMAFNETCLQNNKSLTAAKEKEINELKRQVEELKENLQNMTDDRNCLLECQDSLLAERNELKDTVLDQQEEEDELKRQMDGMEKKYLDALDYKDQIHIDVVKDLTNELAAKEKEMEDWKTIANVYKQRNNELTDPPQMAMGDVNHLEATHDAEMCAFAEWIGVRGWEYSSTNWCFWDINHELISVKTTTELLTKFRER
jgi:chromosome segregation ATPase